MKRHPKRGEDGGVRLLGRSPPVEFVIEQTKLSDHFVIITTRLTGARRLQPYQTFRMDDDGVVTNLAGFATEAAAPQHHDLRVRAAAPVTGPDVQSVQRRTPNHRKIVAHVNPTKPVSPVPALRIVIEATANGRKWTARLGNRVLCASVWPFVKAARRLLAEGYPADTVIEVWRPDVHEWAMRGRLGAVAAMVIEGETASRRAKNGPPIRDLKEGDRRAATGLRSSSGRFWGGR